MKGCKFVDNLIIINMTKPGALFDLDGVLIDSERIYSGFYDRLAEVYEIAEPNFSMVIKGSTIEQILAKYFPSAEASADVMRRINEFESSMEYPICEGVPEFLDGLRVKGIPMAIVTSSSDNKMRKLWAQHPSLRDYFDAIVTGDDITRSKPDPEGYRLAAERIGCDPEECYVFEDSLNGLAAGLAAGCFVIGLATTLPADRLKGKAHKIIDGFAGFTVDDMFSVERH